MKTSVKKLDGCQVRLDVELDAAETAKTVREVEKAFVREARLPGFRPGKVPLDIIRREFADGLKIETERALFGRNVEQAIKDAGIDAVSVVGVKDVRYSAEGASFAATVDVKPVFKLPAYKGLKIAKNDVTVTDEQLSAQVEGIRKTCATYEDAKDGEALADGAFAQIDYSGTVGGKPILEVAPEAKAVAGAENFWVRVEEGYFLPELVSALIGMKVGEKKEDVAVKFPSDAAPEGLAGKKAEYSLALKGFRSRVLPDDAKLAADLKQESYEKFVASLRERMQKDADAQEARRREDEAVELLLKKCDFEVPGSQVERVRDARLSDLAKRAQQSGIDASYFEKNREKIMADATEAAEKQVRVWYIVDAIAKAENIEDKDGNVGAKVVDFVLANAK